MKVEKSVTCPPKQGEGWAERWEGPDKGLICSWLRGREKAGIEFDLRDACLRGELPVLPWAGGVHKNPKLRKKLGTLLYLSMWQGLCGQDLNIDTKKPRVLSCSRTGVVVTFSSKYVAPTEEIDDDDIS